MKHQILQFLKEQSYPVFLEEIAQKFNISQSLVQDVLTFWSSFGYEVECIPHLGYRLKPVEEELDEPKIKAVLKTQWLAQEIIYLPTCPSTNDFLLSYVMNEPFLNGMIAITDQQTKGRGKLDRQWYAEPKSSLTFSCVLKKHLLIHPSLYVLTTAIALAECLREDFKLKAYIKWPNDIFVENRKIAGILADFKMVHAESLLIIGVGMNVFQTMEQFNNCSLFEATSLSHHVACTLSRINILEKFFRHWEIWLDKINLEKGDIIRKWDQYSLLNQKQVSVQTELGSIIGSALGIDENGFLKIKNQNGDIVSVMSGDVEWIQ